MSREISIDEFMEICLDAVLKRNMLGEIRSEASRNSYRNGATKGYRKRGSKGRFKTDKGIRVEVP